VTDTVPIHFFSMPDDDELLRRSNARTHEQMRAALEEVIERLIRDVALAKVSGNFEQEERSSEMFHRAQRALARLDRIRRR
jgi:hypothetical protein